MVSNKNTRLRKRPYTLRARAKRRDEVHHRITLAAVHLHGTIGPARTTVSDIAKHAGVRRATVYNHFPTDLDLIDACSSHWFSEYPPPDPRPWAEISALGLRVETALKEMYAYYDGGREMLAHVLRDAPQVPALAEILQQKWNPLLDGILAILTDGATAPRERLNATLRVTLDFFTWQTLAGSGLSNDAAAQVAAAWVAAARALPA